MRALIVHVLLIGCRLVDPGADGPESVRGFRLVSATPTEAGLRGQTEVTVSYELDGDWPAEPPSPYASINGQFVFLTVDRAARTFRFRPRSDVPGPATLSVRLTGEYPPDAGDMISRDDLFRFVALPAMAEIELYPALIDGPVRPELVRPCARRRSGRVHNRGDQPLEILGFDTGEPAFTMESACGPYFSCDYSICFNGTEPGTYTSTGVVRTTGGDRTFNFAALILPRTPDLDPTFHGTGGRVHRFAIDRADAAADGRLWVNELFGVLAVDHADARATSAPGFVVGLRAHAGGAYVLTHNSGNPFLVTVIRIGPDGVRDPTFAEPDLSWVLHAFGGLEVANGRILAIATDGVVAMVDGVPDPSYGTDGIARFDPALGYVHPGISGVDGQGRLYLVFGDRVVRLTAGGAIDPAFTFAQSATALVLDPAGLPIVATATGVSRLGETGAVASTIPLTGVRDIALDDAGRLYLTRDTGTTRRFAADGTFDRMLGFGNTRGVRCSAGPCWMFGRDALDGDYIVRLAE